MCSVIFGHQGFRDYMHRQILREDYRPRSHGQGVLYGVLQFPDITRPVKIQQFLLGGMMKGNMFKPCGITMLFYKMTCQW